MRRFNVLTGELPVQQDRPGFNWRGRRGVARESELRWLGASVFELPDGLLGAAVYELDPGERTGPYHYEVGNEECLLVLAGKPTLRHPEGRDVLDAGDMVMFADGEVGAHQVINESSEVARVLILSTMRVPFGCVYPDSGKVSTFAGVFPVGATVDYWDGESADA